MYRESCIVLVPGSGWIKGFYGMDEMKNSCSMNDNALETILHLNNCGGLVGTPESKEAAAGINDQIRKLVANAKDLIQPLDLFIIL